MLKIEDLCSSLAKISISSGIFTIYYTSLASATNSQLNSEHFPVIGIGTILTIAPIVLRELARNNPHEFRRAIILPILFMVD